MQVILKEKIRKLGVLGDVVNVKPGFARNFLIPQSKALFASKENLAKFDAEKAKFEAMANEVLSKAQARAESFKDFVVTMSASTGEGGKLFGSIGTRDIAEAVSKEGRELHKHEIRLPNGVIRMIGEYDIGIGLHSDVETTIKLVVVPA